VTTFLQDFSFWKALMRPWSVTLLNGSLSLVDKVWIATVKLGGAGVPPAASWLCALVKQRVELGGVRGQELPDLGAVRDVG